MEVIDGERVQSLFDHLEARKNVLSTCTDLYKTLTSHFSSLDRSLSQQSQTLDSKIQSLQSESHETLSLLDHRERSIPERAASLSAEIEARKQAALSEIDNPAQHNAGFVETLRSLCRRMDAPGLLNFLVLKRRESLSVREIMVNALGECVDPPRLVLDVVEVFVKKAAANKPSGNRVGGGLTDWRWACSVVVGGLFPLDDSKDAAKKMEGVKPPFAGRIVQRAKDVIEQWKEKMEGSSGVLNRVGPSEVAMLLQLVIGFGLKEKFDQEFLRKLVLEFAALRRDMPKLAVQIFEDKIGDIIDELVNNGMEIEAIYFATEAGLTQRFQPASLLKTYLNNCKRNTANIPKKGNSSSASMDDSINSEMNPVKAIVKCVEDLALEDQFPLNDLRKRLADMEKTKVDKKKNSSAPNKPLNKRAHGIRTSHQPNSRPTKAPKISNSYPSFSHRNPAPQLHQSPVTRYHGSYNYPTQAAYETTMAPANPYTSVYGESLASSSSALPVQPPHYSLPVDNVGVAGSHLGGRSSVSG